MGGNQGVIESETHRVPAEKWRETERLRERERVRERETERETEGLRDGDREMESGLWVGKLQGSLKPLKERYKLHMFPSVLASRFLDVPGLYKGQACTDCGHAERPDLWRRAPRNEMSTPDGLGSKCSQHPQESKETFPKNQRERKRGVNPPGCISTPVVGKPGQETTIQRLLRLQISKCVHCYYEDRFRWMERLASSKGEDGP